MAVNEQGKFTKKTDDVVRKLEEALAIDATVDEACFFANISKSTYYEWIKEDKILKERLEDLRNNPVLLARQTVVNKISESYTNAMDYLKRKKKLEFGDNIDVTSDNKPIPILGGQSNGISNNNSDKETSKT